MGRLDHLLNQCDPLICLSKVRLHDALGHLRLSGLESLLIQLLQVFAEQALVKLVSEKLRLVFLLHQRSCLSKSAPHLILVLTLLLLKSVVQFDLALVRVYLVHL